MSRTYVIDRRTTKKFAGKSYGLIGYQSYITGGQSKRQARSKAKAEAKEARAQGLSARIVDTRWGFQVFGRRR